MFKIKDNQKELREEITDYVSDEILCEKMDMSETVEKNHGRTEQRTAYITQNIDWLYDKEKWSKSTLSNIMLDCLINHLNLKKPLSENCFP